MFGTTTHDDDLQAVLDGIPDEYRTAADEVREHLVTVRGGAPFLSNADAITLIDWLDMGVAVSTILRAIERAAEARRKTRSRFPLTLGKAKRHLNKPTSGVLQARHVPDAPGPLGPLLHTLHVDTRPELAPLETRLRGIAHTDPDAVVREALAAFRDFFGERWNALSDTERAGYLSAARTELGDLADLVDEGTLQDCAEELARDRLRQQYPWLTAATLWDLVQ